MSSYFNTKLLLLPPKVEHLSAVKALLEKEKAANTNLESSPHITLINKEAETLKIKSVRNIIEELAYSSYQGKKRWYILLHADKASIPAQNALLKVIEEPPSNTQIVLTCSSLTNLLPTIQSRSEIITINQLKGTEEHSSYNKNEIEKVFASLEQLSYADAVALAGQYKDRDAALELVTNLLIHTSNILNRDGSSKEIVQLSKALLETRLALQKNLNPALAMEQLFFSAVSIYK